MKVVINRCFGGFALSEAAYSKLAEWGADPSYSWTYDHRDDAMLVRVVEELGGASNGLYSDLTVVEIPDGVDYEIDEYDGIETIHEVHRSWP